jgi:hypothetical protein
VKDHKLKMLLRARGTGTVTLAGSGDGSDCDIDGPSLRVVPVESVDAQGRRAPDEHHRRYVPRVPWRGETLPSFLTFPYSRYGRTFQLYGRALSARGATVHHLDHLVQMRIDVAG